MRLTSTGLGIGTSSPATRLHVAGPAGNPGRLTLSEGGAQSVIYATRNSDTNGDLRFQTEIGGTIADRMVIDYSGNVGIGTSSPLHQVMILRRVGSTITAPLLNLQSQNSGSVDGDSFILYGTQTANWAAGVDQADSNKFRIEPTTTLGAAAGLTITTGGIVGIGTSTPSILLTVGPAYGGTANTESRGLFQAAGNAYLTIGAGAASDSGVLFADSGANNAGFVGYNHSTNALTFGTASTERARITSGGNFGIGVTDANAPLDIKSNSAANAITIRARNGNDFSFLVFRQADGTEDLGGIANQRTAANTGNLLFYTAGGSAAAERARIDSSGNLLVGTTSVPYSLTNGRISAGNTGAGFYAATFYTTVTTNSVVVGIGNPNRIGKGGIAQALHIQVER